MSTVIFYEKPGCINNTKQKALLRAAGHEVEAHNLLTAPWTENNLRPFFGSLAVEEWFNRSAPAIKAGEVIPETLTADMALQLMVQNPLLIRRPLMQVGNQKMVGFDINTVDAWIGLQPIEVTSAATNPALQAQDLQTCPRTHADTFCSSHA
ncbi:MAG TPA: ArsC/Spx/MgsR family protein [Stenomitos sp.]